MTTLIIFLVLTLAESVFVWYQFGRLEDANSVGEIASSVLGVKEQYKGFTAKVVNFFTRFKFWKVAVWIAVSVTLLCNFIAALILSFLVGLVL